MEQIIPNYHDCRTEGNLEYRTATLKAKKNSNYFTSKGWHILNVRQRSELVEVKKKTRTKKDKWGYTVYEYDRLDNAHRVKETVEENVYEHYWDYDLCRDLNDPKVIHFMSLDNEEQEINRLLLNLKDVNRRYRMQQSDEWDLFEEFKRSRKMSGVFKLLNFLGYIMLLGGALLFLLKCLIMIIFGGGLTGNITFIIYLVIAAVGLLAVILMSKREKKCLSEFERQRKEEYKRINKAYYTVNDIADLEAELKVSMNKYAELYKKL